MYFLKNLLYSLIEFIVTSIFVAINPSLALFQLVIFCRFPTTQNFILFFLSNILLQVYLRYFKQKDWFNQQNNILNHLRQYKNNELKLVSTKGLEELILPFIENRLIDKESNSVDKNVSKYKKKLLELMQKNIKIVRFENASFSSYFANNKGFIFLGNTNWNKLEEVPITYLFMILHEIAHGFETLTKGRKLNYKYIPILALISVFFIEYNFISIGLFTLMLIMTLSELLSGSTFDNSSRLEAEFEADMIAISLFTPKEKHKLLEHLAERMTTKTPFLDDSLSKEQNIIRIGRIMHNVREGEMKYNFEVVGFRYKLNEIARMLIIIMLGFSALDPSNFVFSIYKWILISLIVIFFLLSFKFDLFNVQTGDMIDRIIYGKERNE